MYNPAPGNDTRRAGAPSTPSDDVADLVVDTVGHLDLLCYVEMTLLMEAGHRIVNCQPKLFPAAAGKLPE